MKMLLIDFGLCFSGLMLLVACGWCAISPLRQQIKFPYAASGLAGMLLLSCGSLTINIITLLPFKIAVLIAATILISASIVTGRLAGLPRREWYIQIGLAVFLTFSACVSILYREIELNSPTMVFSSGSDQFGYAHLADWITNHPKTPKHTPDPADVYASWVDIMLNFDPRFGAISLMAIVSLLSDRSGLFSYNLTCALVLIVSSLGLAGIFARTVLGLFLVSFGLFVSSWFSLSTMGFLGKIIGYPASLFCIGLFFAYVRQAKTGNMPLFVFVVALAVAVSASLTFSGMAVATLLIVVGGLVLLFDKLFESDTQKPTSYSRNDLYSALIAMSAVALFSSGTIARPLYLTNPPFDAAWGDLWIRAAQVVSTESIFSLLPTKLLYVLASVVAVLWMAICILTIWRRQSEATALLCGTASIAFLLAVTGQKWKFYETLSIYIPAAICAVGIAINDQQMIICKKHETVNRLLSIFATAIILLGLGRFITTLAYTVGPKAYSPFTFSLSEFNKLTEIVREGGGAYVDTPDVSMIYPIVLEFTKRSIPFQLSPQAWKAFLGYRPWEAPLNPSTYSLTITDQKSPYIDKESVVFTTRQYFLMRSHKP